MLWSVLSSMRWGVRSAPVRGVSTCISRDHNRKCLASGSAKRTFSQELSPHEALQRATALIDAELSAGCSALHIEDLRTSLARCGLTVQGRPAVYYVEQYQSVSRQDRAIVLNGVRKQLESADPLHVPQSEAPRKPPAVPSTGHERDSLVNVNSVHEDERTPSTGNGQPGDDAASRAHTYAAPSASAVQGRSASHTTAHGAEQARFSSSVDDIGQRHRASGRVGEISARAPYDARCAYAPGRGPAMQPCRAHDALADTAAARAPSHNGNAPVPIAGASLHEATRDGAPDGERAASLAPPPFRFNFNGAQRQGLVIDDADASSAALDRGADVKAATVDAAGLAERAPARSVIGPVRTAEDAAAGCSTSDRTEASPSQQRGKSNADAPPARAIASGTPGQQRSHATQGVPNAPPPPPQNVASLSEGSGTASKRDVPSTAPPTASHRARKGVGASAYAGSTAAAARADAQGPARSPSVPFGTDGGEPWLCRALFGPRSESSYTVGPYQVTRTPCRHQSAALQGRDVVQVQCEGLGPSGRFQMVSLHESEVQEVERVERRFAATAYDRARHVRICFDTETTDRPRIAWWEGPPVIIQIAAVADPPEGVGAPSTLSQDLNPYPYSSSAKALQVHKQGDDTSHAREVPLHVGMARFLDFCLDVSERSGGAVPVLVAHNAGFDIRMLQNTCWRAGLPAGDPTWATFDTYAMARCLQASGAFKSKSSKLVDLAEEFKLDVDKTSLHDACYDARQIPGIIQGMSAVAGYDDNIAELLKTPAPSPKTGKGTIQTLGGRPTVADYITERSEALAKSTRRSHRKAQSGGAASTQLGEALDAAKAVDPAEPQAGPQRRRHSSAGAQAGGDTAEEAPARWDAVESSAARASLSKIIASNTLEDPFLRVAERAATRREGTALFSSKHDLDGTAAAWAPIAMPIATCGLAKRVLRKPVIEKLKAAGFETLLDVLRHTPRLEKTQYPSVHVKEHVGEKVQVRGSVLAVKAPYAGARASVLRFEVALELTGDDGLLVQHRFPATLFAAGMRGTFKLQYDEKALRKLQASAADVRFQGQFKEDSKVPGSSIMFTVKSYDAVAASESASTAEPAALDQDEQALAVYASRQPLKSMDFAALLPKIVDHLIESLGDAQGQSDAEYHPGDFVPRSLVEQHGLLPFLDALDAVHAPLGEAVPADVRARARERLAFNELLLLSISMLHYRTRTQRSAAEQAFMAPVICTSSALMEAGLEAMPFELTGAQRRCAREILDDMRRPVAMHRLLQGDVGSGKTAVAFLACLQAIGSGYQTALLVPNGVLAAQHMSFIAATCARMPEAMRPRVELVVGKTGVKARRQVRDALATGEVDILVGTTALNNEGEQFDRLGLIIIDEQHRFGVKQRADLQKKDLSAAAPHVLHMTATPIPRTIAMTQCSHMAVSVLDELPPGRKPIQTRVVKVPQGSAIVDNVAARERVRRRVEAELEAGGSIFWVFPLVNDSESCEHRASVVTAYQSLLSEGGILAEHAMHIHGRLKAEEKETILDAFRSGVRRLLLATVVIEVGIDVSDATLMVVENAECFGLLQLHQLRGRVGRSDRQSECWLVTAGGKALERISALQSNYDGFSVAEHDMRIRGAGQLYGQRQSGPAQLGLGELLPTADLARDGDLMSSARAAAAQMVDEHGFKGLPQRTLAALTAYRMSTLLELGLQDVDVHW